MNRVIRFLVVVLLLPHLAACGGAATRAASGGSTAEPKAEKSAIETKSRKDAAPPAAGEEDAPPSSDREDADTSKSASEPTPTPEEASKNDMAIDVSMKPSCVRRTETTTMTVKAEKYADISYGLSYADGQSHGQYGLGRANGKGVFVKSFVVPLDAAIGEATVLVAGINVKNSHGGSTQDAFEVASTSC